MKLFSCQNCQQIVFFESTRCTSCAHMLGFAPDRGRMCALEPVESAPVSEGRAGEAVPTAPDAAGAPSPAAPASLAVSMRVVKDPSGALYRPCRNQTEHDVCNWLIPASADREYCPACRLNHIIPNLGTIEARQAWYRLEAAKRRVLYTLFELGLPVESRVERPNGGLEFEFLQDSPSPDGPHVYTGHNDGIITINIAEADDPFREKMRVQMGEAYRTVLGHFRHEIGHYYWDRLIKNTPRIDAFRQLFGDEQMDYAAAQQRHYQQGVPADWHVRFVSPYASMHPWEDWAEAWAHYMHIVDTLETARAFSLSLQPVRGEAARAVQLAVATRRIDPHSFEDLIAGWIPLTMALNALNRSMGLSDGYPFVLSEIPIAKMRFVHDTIAAVAAGDTQY